MGAAIMTRRPRKIAEQVIAITGASSGIGLLVARKAAHAGARVALISRNADVLHDLVDEIVAAGGDALALPADVGSADALVAAAAAIVERYGRIDCWINDAGVAIYAKLADTPIEEHQRLFQTNYFGVVNGSLAALPHLRASGGSLLTVASIASDLPSPLLGAYSASKHAVKGFINSLRIELNSEGSPVAVTLIKPSGVDTPIAQHAVNHEGTEVRVPPPVYDPEIVAQAILDAVERPRREITIGGLGRLNVILVQHFPKLLDWIAPVMIPILAPPRPPTLDMPNLFLSSEAGRVRSGVEHGRTFSFYAAFQRHRLWLGAVATGILLASLAVPGLRQRGVGHPPSGR
jgi:short-subunit dehydrogenase